MRRIRRLLVPAALLVLVGCAEQPVAPPAAVVSAPPPAPPVVDAHLAQAISRHQRLALDLRKEGNHAAAAAQWQILLLFDPANHEYTKELAATRQTIQLEAHEQLRRGQSAYASGDLDRAAAAMLRVLVLEPGQPDATRILREVDRRRLSRIQADRAARARPEEVPATSRSTRVTPSDGGAAADAYEADLALELFRAGDTAGGLRELHAWVDAHPANHATRQRIGAAVAEKARELEDRGAREQAFDYYGQATSLRGPGQAPWAQRAAALRKSLSQEYYEQGTRAFRTDLAQAIRLLEKSVAVDPNNARAATRLKEARAARDKLDRIGGTAARPP